MAWSEGEDGFRAFVALTESRLRRGLMAAYGPDRGRYPLPLCKLPQRQRVVVYLVHAYGFPVDEVAGLSGVSTPTVRPSSGAGSCRSGVL